MIKIYCNTHPPENALKKSITIFLFQELAQYGDPQDDIAKAIDYALKPAEKSNGLIVTYWKDDILIGATVTNSTGMKGYIPENILVYIATHHRHRGKGLGKEMMLTVIENSIGNIALHVEPDNPAKRLYESLGFTNKYLEMRLIKG